MGDDPDASRVLRLIGWDGLLSESERATATRVRAFVDEAIRPNIAEWYAAGVLPASLVPVMGQLGLFGMHLDGYGCAGSSAVEYGLACLELEAGDSGLRSLVSVQGSLTMFSIWRYGSEDQKQRWLPKLAAGQAVGCFALTEPHSGSDPGSMRTTARRRGKDWLIQGEKRWVTNGPIADVMTVWARMEDGDVGGFLVPTTSPGLEIRPITNKLSFRASASSEVSLVNVLVPETARLPEARGLRAPLSCLDEARFGIIFGVMGAALECVETVLAYSLERGAFGQTLAHFQLTQAKLADAAAEIAKGLLLALHLGREKDARRLRPEQVSLGKMSNVRAALSIARTCRSVLGANGITLDFPVMRHMNNLETVLTYEGTDEIHSLIVGRALTGVSAFGR